MAATRLKASSRVSAKSALEEAMAFNMKAVGIPTPVRELHFDWCCQHQKRRHVDDNIGVWCMDCGTEGRDGEYHAFARGRDWRFDFAWVEQRVALEIEGGTWSGGRHTRGKGFEEDAAKYAAAAILGWKVLRATGAQVRSNEALRWVEQALGVSK